MTQTSYAEDQTQIVQLLGLCLEEDLEERVSQPNVNFVNV
jgi:hypothetical protein